MYIHEALAKSSTLRHPAINGIVAFLDNWDMTIVRIAITGDAEEVRTFDTFEMTLDRNLLLSNEWVPVKFEVTIEELK